MIVILGDQVIQKKKNQFRYLGLIVHKKRRLWRMFIESRQDS